MTPQAEAVFHSPMPKDRRGLVREILSGAQFFDCSELKPIVTARSEMPGDWHCADEILQCELPSDHTWIDFGQCSIGLSRDEKGAPHQSGRIINLIGVYAEIDKDDGPYVLPFFF
jgi:hypothetical protein